METIGQIFSILKYSAIIVGFVVFIFVVVMIIKNIKQWIRRSRLDDEGVNRKVIKSRWQEIENLMSRPGEMGHKMAILEADKLLDFALKSMMMPGNTLGERLKFACYKYNRLKNVWWAHKVRNKLAHEPSFHLDKRIAEKAVKDFEKALRELGAL